MGMVVTTRKNPFQSGIEAQAGTGKGTTKLAGKRGDRLAPERPRDPIGEAIRKIQRVKDNEDCYGGYRRKDGKINGPKGAPCA